MSRFQFRHILFQKYIYAALDEVERVHLHEQVGVTLEGLYGSPEAAGVIALELARHFHEAGIVDKAITYLHRAGDSAVRMSAYDEGMIHLKRALELLRTLPDSQGRLQTELALQLSIIKASRADILSPEWLASTEKARELCTQTGGSAALAQVLGEQSIAYYVRGQYPKALELSEEALALAETADDPMPVALGHWRLGFIHFVRGEFLASREHLGRVLAFYKPQVHHQSFVLLHGSDAGASAMSYEACCLWMLGYPDQALRLGRETLALARDSGHAFSLADVMCFAGGMLSKLRGDASALKESAEELMRVSRGFGVSTFAGSGACFHGDALAHLGQVEEGIAEMNSGLASRRSRGSACTLSGMLGSLAEAYALAGHPERGLAALDEAMDFVERTGERHWLAELHRLRGELLQQQGNDAEAETSLLTAIDVARDQQAKSWELRAAISLGRLWCRRGKQAEAKALLETVYNWFTEGFETTDLVEARQLLEELSH